MCTVLKETKKKAARLLSIILYVMEQVHMLVYMCMDTHTYMYDSQYNAHIHTYMYVCMCDTHYMQYTCNARLQTGKKKKESKYAIVYVHCVVQETSVADGWPTQNKQCYKTRNKAKKPVVLCVCAQCTAALDLYTPNCK